MQYPDVYFVTEAWIPGVFQPIRSTVYEVLLNQAWSLGWKKGGFTYFTSVAGILFSERIFAKVLSIGSTTAKALADVGIEVSQACSKPTPESLVEALNLIR